METEFPGSFAGECELFWVGFDDDWVPDIVLEDDSDFCDVSFVGPKFVL